MKIIFLHMTLGLSDRGSEKVVSIEAAELAKKHEVHVIQSGPARKAPYHIHRVMPLVHAPTPAPRTILDKVRRRIALDEESLATRRFTVQALTLIEKLHPDVVIPVNGAGQIHLLRKYFPKLPIVAFGHAGIGMHDRASLMEQPHVFVCLTEQSHLWAESLARPSTKLVTIPNPYVPAAKKKTEPLMLRRPIVMTAGALSAYKNIEDIIQAIRRMTVSYLLVGDGEKHDQVAAELSKVSNQFRWIQHAEPYEMDGLYQSADVFCYVPDHQESFGMVYLEAMAAGLPIIATDDAIRREIIGEHGLYVAPHDIDSIVSAIIQAVQLDKVDYSHELRRFHPRVVVRAIEKELYDLVKK